MEGGVSSEDPTSDRAAGCLYAHAGRPAYGDTGVFR